MEKILKKVSGIGRSYEPRGLNPTPDGYRSRQWSHTEVMGLLSLNQGTAGLPWQTSVSSFRYWQLEQDATGWILRKFAARFAWGMVTLGGVFSLIQK